jgi:hypothetical protein
MTKADRYVVALIRSLKFMVVTPCSVVVVSTHRPALHVLAAVCTFTPVLALHRLWFVPANNIGDTGISFMN